VQAQTHVGTRIHFGPGARRSRSHALLDQRRQAGPRHVDDPRIARVVHPRQRRPERGLLSSSGQSQYARLELIVTDGKTFTDVETLDTLHSVVVPDPAALIFTQINTARSGRYRISKTYVTDPVRDALLIRLKLEVLAARARAPRLGLLRSIPQQLRPVRYRVQPGQRSGVAYSGESIATGRRQCRGNPRRRKLGPDGRAGIRRHQQRFCGSKRRVGQPAHHHTLAASYESAEDGNVAQIAELPEALAEASRLF